jgi:hypothetical protein
VLLLWETDQTILLIRISLRRFARRFGAYWRAYAPEKRRLFGSLSSAFSALAPPPGLP